MSDSIALAAFIDRWRTSPFGLIETAPWLVIKNIEHHVRTISRTLAEGYHCDGDVLIHRSAIVEPGATVKGPAIIGPDSFVAAGAYLRGGVFLEKECIIGPGSEVKSSVIFRGSKLAHLNFVGDSILGREVNVEAGAIIANYRNELDDKAINILFEGAVIETGLEKFGALVGDGSRIGANAVLAPGAILRPNSIVARTALVDQHPGSGRG